MKKKLRLHYRFSPGLNKYVWFMDLGIEGWKTSYKDTSTEAIMCAGEYEDPPVYHDLGIVGTLLEIVGYGIEHGITWQSNQNSSRCGNNAT